MRWLLGVATLLVHLALLLALAPVLGGLLSWLRARLLGGVGASPLQPWRDLLRLARKQPVVAETASWLFEAAPSVAFATTVAAAALVPGFALGMADAALADLLAIAGLLLFGRCILALAALDSGTSLGGLGATRTVTVAALAEPVLLMLVFALALPAGSTNLDAIALAQLDAGLLPSSALVPAALAGALAALASAGRAPVANQASRLELGLLDQATALEYAGWQLALIEWTAALRLLLWMSLLLALFVPFGMAAPDSALAGWLLALPLWLGKLAALAIVLVALEAAVGWLPFRRVPAFCGLALVLALAATVLLLLGQGGT